MAPVGNPISSLLQPFTIFCVLCKDVGSMRYFTRLLLYGAYWALLLEGMYNIITKVPKQYLGIARVTQVIMPNIPVLGVVFVS